MRKLILLLVVFGFVNYLSAQTYTGNAAPSVGAINNDGFDTSCFPLTVTGLKNGGIINTTYGLDSVKINITCPYDADLYIQLTAPDGTVVALSNYEGGAGVNFKNTVFNAYAPIPISSGTAPFTGSFIPDGTLGAVNNGQNGNGVWTLCVYDEAFGSTKKSILVNWSLVFDNTPAPPPPPPPVQPPCSSTGLATGDCDSAPLVCNFQGFCGCTCPTYEPPHYWPSLYDPNTGGGAFCGSIEDNSFIKFVASASAASFHVWCYNSQQGLGIQTFFWDGGCNGATCTGYGCNDEIYPGDTTIYATGLTPGNVYYLMFDGFAGDFCNYTVAPETGVSFFSLSANPASAYVCKGTPVDFSVATGGVDTATAKYSWSASTTPSYLNVDTGRSVIVNTNNLNIGQYYYSVTGTSVNGCPSTLTDTINIVDQLSISTYPTTQSDYVGYPTIPLVANATSGGSPIINYQWYINTTNSNVGGTAIVGADSATYTPPDTPAGIFYYYCVVNNGGCTQIGNVVIVKLSVPPVCSSPDSIKFIQQPTTTQQGTYITPGIKVEEYCSSTGVISTNSGFVTLLVSDGGCGYISQTEPFVNGIATFDSVMFTRSQQNNITLTAISKGFPSIVSKPFSVIPKAAYTVLTVIRSDDFSPTPVVAWTPPTYGPIVVVGTTGTKGTDVSGVINPTGTNYYLRKSYSRNNGTGAYGTTNTFTFANNTGLNVYDSLDFYFKIASLNANGTSVAGNGAGVNTTQDLVVETSVDGGTTWQNLLTHQGGNNLLFQFDSTSVANLSLGAGQVYPSTDSTSDFHVSILPKTQGINQFQFRVTATDNRKNQNWSIDDVILTGTQIIPSVDDSLPKVIALKNESICSGSTASLSAIVSNAASPVSYDWSPASGFSNASDTALANPTTAPLTSNQSYSVTITDKDNCVAKSNVVNIKINSLITDSISFATCNSYTWHGTNYTKSGIYTFDTVSAGGCDSLVVLKLSISKTILDTISVSVCNSYTWHGTTYTTSGSYSFDTSNAAHCDSLTILNLTISKPSTDTIILSACNSYTWHGTAYTNTGTYTFDTVTVGGGHCDSIVVLKLTISNSVTNTLTVSACNSYTWHGTAYTNTGTYTFDTVTTTGTHCDSLTVLQLTISKSITDTISASACNSFTWHGTNYTTSGVYKFDTLGASGFGCDSLTVLKLAINKPSSSNIDTTICYPNTFTWNSTVYSTSATETVTLLNSVGCDSVATLNLTVDSLPLVSKIVAIPADTSIGINTTITLSDSTLNGVWTNSNSTIASLTSVGSVATIKGLSQGFDTIRYFVSNLCGLDSADYIVSVTSSNVFIPNVFTPDAQNNNIFFIRTNTSYKDVELWVFSSWGNQIFHSNSIDNGWDGTYNGKAQPTGVYVYVAKLTDANGKVTIKKGSITLIR
jgi:gliding motility-associated-like protein